TDCFQRMSQIIRFTIRIYRFMLKSAKSILSERRIYDEVNLSTPSSRDRRRKIPKWTNSMQLWRSTGTALYENILTALTRSISSPFSSTEMPQRFATASQGARTVRETPLGILLTTLQ